MNPSAGPAASSASQFSPSASPLHPPSVQHNLRVISSLSTLSACFSGLVAGILGLTNTLGFLLYFSTAILSLFINVALKCGPSFDVGKYVPQAHQVQGAGQGQPGSGGGPAGAGGKVIKWKGYLALSGIGQEGLLGFLLFWIGSYALIHVYD